MKQKQKKKQRKKKEKKNTSEKEKKMKKLTRTVLLGRTDETNTTTDERNTKTDETINSDRACRAPNRNHFNELCVMRLCASLLYM
jgi:hypothetical protein